MLVPVSVQNVSVSVHTCVLISECTSTNMYTYVPIPISTFMYQVPAVRLFTRTSHWSNILPVLASLHWLPVTYRINYNVVLITYKPVPLPVSIPVAVHTHTCTCTCTNPAREEWAVLELSQVESDEICSRHEHEWQQSRVWFSNNLPRILGGGGVVAQGWR